MRKVVVILIVVSVICYSCPKKRAVAAEAEPTKQKVGVRLQLQTEDLNDKNHEYALSEVLVILNEDNNIDKVKSKEIKGLLALLEGKDIKDKREAVVKLQSLGKAAVPVIIELLPEVSVPVKAKAVFILGNIKDKEAVSVLMKILRADNNAYVRRHAAEALGKIADESAVYVLSTALFDQDDSVRQRAAHALGQIGDIRAIEPLIDRLQDEQEERVKIVVVNALGKLKSDSATNPLLNEFNSRCDQIYKDEVVTALGDIGDSRALPDLTKYLEKLKAYKPTEKILLYEHENTIQIAEEAIRKMQENL